MANQVYANGREISCKAGKGKSIAAFPDVCFTPPQTPATPPGVPIPYPNTGMSSDTTDGSKSVKISGKEIMLKNKSCFKKSTGDEAGSAPKKGVVTSKITGKVYFTSWSMDVKFEGENVVRHLDLTTHNHGSEPPNTPTGPHIDESAASNENEKEKKCNHQWDCTANPGGKAKTSSNLGDAFEARAIAHNNPKPADISPFFKCKKCPATKEVDHVMRDSNNKITKIVQCKADLSKEAGGDSEKGVTIKSSQLREDRKLVAAINECQKGSGAIAQVEYKLQDGEAAKAAEAFLLKKDPPLIVKIP